MKTSIKLLIVTVLAVTVVAAVTLKQGKPRIQSQETPAATAASNSPAENRPKSTLPRLVDLGAGKCIPCRKMAPILEVLKKEYAGRMNVEFIDVWVNPDASKAYGIRMIPTQIFYDAAGKDLFRHEGFFAKEDILAKWKELGIDLSGKQSPVTK
jgi:thioredoxin 1